MAFTNLRTTMDMAEWDAATVKINYALKSAVLRELNAYSPESTVRRSTVELNRQVGSTVPAVTSGL